jgi:hypothetical protein
MKGFTQMLNDGIMVAKVPNDGIAMGENWL